MDLDNLDFLKKVDASDMLRHIDGLPEQFETAWQHARNMPLPDSLKTVRQVVISGMGGSAIGGDLLAAAIATRSSVPIVVIRGYELPTWVTGEHTLVIASSFSGNTEETLSAYQQAVSQKAQVIGITTGGTLVERLSADHQTAWTFQDTIGQPRAAIGWSFGMLLGLAHRAGWAQNLEADFASAMTTLKSARESYLASVPAVRNPAKRQAGQLVGRLPVIIAGGILEPVGKRWKTQLNENSKTAAVFEPMPEMNHNAVVGIEFPRPVLEKLAVMAIVSPQYDHPRNLLRHKLVADMFLMNGMMIDRFEPQGDNPIAQMMHAIQLGDYISYYTALAYEADPTVIVPIQELKKALADYKS